MRLVRFAARRGRVPIVTAAVGVECAWQPVGSDDLGDPQKTRCRAFLVDEKHRIAFRGCVVHRHDQVPVHARHPLVGAAVLTDQHPDQRRPRPALAVFAPPRRLADHAAGLQRLPDPAVAARSVVAAPIPGVKVFEMPARVPAPVQRLRTQHLVHRRAPRRHPAQPFVLVGRWGCPACTHKHRAMLATNDNLRRCQARKPD